jgi:hypothetical protein
MPLPTHQFQAQARKAGRTIYWHFETVWGGLFAAFIGFIGLLLICSVLWFGIIAVVIALGITGYLTWRVKVGRHQALNCPNCAVRGEIVKIGQSYQFHCSRCDQTAETGIDTTGV